MKHKFTKRLIISLCIIVLQFYTIPFDGIISYANSIKLVDSGIDYKETTQSLSNPERGYMANYFLYLRPKGSDIVSTNEPFCHLFFSIGDFSNAQNGGRGDLNFTEDMLNSLNLTFKALREAGSTAIIRFSYDNFQGTSDAEPAMKQIIKHIAQLKPVFYANQDVISSVEAGFVGKWGEMHGSKLTDDKSISYLIDALLDAVPVTRPISVRQPRHYSAWLGIDISDIHKNLTREGTPEYRVGIYNDGYLGSASDLGTFQDREKELLWLKEQATHTFYGGEIPSVSDDDYYMPDKCIPEMFVTHTIYLNGGRYSEWGVRYSGRNTAYLGETAGKYITDHMGYRFVLKNSMLSYQLKQGGTLKIEAKIENTGFANIINKKELEVIYLKDNQYYSQIINTDVRKWKSNSLNLLNLQMNLPSDMLEGDWKVYIRISNPNEKPEDDTKWTIAFANSNTWNTDLNANYIGTFTVVYSAKPVSTTSMVLNTITGNMALDGVRSSSLEYTDKDILYEYKKRKVYIKNDEKYLYILVLDENATGYHVVEMGFYNEKIGRNYRTYSTSPNATANVGYAWYGIGSKELSKSNGYAHTFLDGSIEYRIPLGTMFGTFDEVTLNNFYINFMNLDWNVISNIKADRSYTIKAEGGRINGIKIITGK